LTLWQGGQADRRTDGRADGDSRLLFGGRFSRKLVLLRILGGLVGGSFCPPLGLLLSLLGFGKLLLSLLKAIISLGQGRSWVGCDLLEPAVRRLP